VQSRYADILLRTRREFQPHVLPIVAHLAELPAASPKLKQLLAENPPWRPHFFADLPQGISDARTPLDLFLAIKNTPTPATNACSMGPFRPPQAAFLSTGCFAAETASLCKLSSA
jgi:hypothetical protein